MRYYVDTEFNGNEGQLISVALVREDGAEFYAVLDTYQMPVPWVNEHVYSTLFAHECKFTPHPHDRVIPASGAAARPVSREECKRSLAKFLEHDKGVVTFVADWPEDLTHTLNLLLRDHGKRNSPVSFRCLILDLPGFNTADVSIVAHNALEDARVLHAFVEQGLTDGEGGALVAADLELLRNT
jgi:hypothetical protein